MNKKVYSLISSSDADFQDFTNKRISRMNRREARNNRNNKLLLLLIIIISTFFYFFITKNFERKLELTDSDISNLDKDFSGGNGLRKMTDEQKQILDIISDTLKLEEKIDEQSKKIDKLLDQQTVFSKSPYSNKKELPKPVVNALLKYGDTFLKYEVNGGNRADQELVLAVLTRRLIQLNKKYPEWNEDKLISKLARRWNPGKHKDFEQIARSVRNKKEQIDYSSLLAAATLDYKTSVGKDVWDKGYNHFAHTKKLPWYYPNLAKAGSLNQKHGLKWKTYIGKG